MHPRPAGARRRRPRVGHDGDLADIAHRPEEAGAVRVAGHHPKGGATLRQGLDELAADEARATENRDDLVAHLSVLS
jgi:hypothetical protein